MARKKETPEATREAVEPEPGEEVFLPNSDFPTAISISRMSINQSPF
jgi:hypothetical protein